MEINKENEILELDWNPLSFIFAVRKPLCFDFSYIFIKINRTMKIDTLLSVLMIQLLTRILVKALRKDSMVSGLLL